MNAQELQTFDKKTRRRLFAWEVLVAIHDKRLKAATHYVGKTPNTSTCESCAIGTAYVFCTDWKNPDVTGISDMGHQASIDSMQKMGFSKRQIDLIEWLFETDDFLGDDNVQKVNGDDKNTFYGDKIDYQYMERLSRMEAIYQRLFNNKNGAIEVEASE